MFFTLNKILIKSDPQIVISGITGLLLTAGFISYFLENEVGSILFFTTGVAIYNWGRIVIVHQEPEKIQKGCSSTTDFKLRILELAQKMPDTLSVPVFKSTIENIDETEFESVPDPNAQQIIKAVAGTGYLKSENLLKEIGSEYTLKIANKETVDIILANGVDSTKIIFVEVYDKAWLGNPSKNTLITNAW